MYSIHIYICFIRHSSCLPSLHIFVMSTGADNCPAPQLQMTPRNIYGNSCVFSCLPIVYTFDRVEFVRRLLVVTQLWCKCRLLFYHPHFVKCVNIKLSICKANFIFLRFKSLLRCGSTEFASRYQSQTTETGLYEPRGTQIPSLPHP